MKTAYQYRLYPSDKQKISLNNGLRVCRYWYNRMLGERLDWWEQNRCPVNSCPLICHLPELKERPNYYNQKNQLPSIKEDLVLVRWSGELLDFSDIYSTILQDVCKRVDKAFERYIKGDKDGKRSGKPRFKSESRYRTMVFDGAKNEWLKFCTVNGRWLYLRLPKIGLVKVRTHRPIPDGFNLKQVSVTNKSDGWYVSFILDDPSVPDFTPDKTIPTWDNSMGLDAVLNEDVYIATSEGESIPSLKPLRKNLDKLGKLQTKRNAKNKGSRRRRKLAKREARFHQRIARSRQDFQYKSAYKLVRTGKKVFFCEDLNLKGLTKRNAPKQDDDGKYLPNGQSAKSGLNKSWLDAAFGQFFSTLSYIAAKAGAVVVEKNPAYTSQILCYRDEFVFTDCSIREYWDEQLQIWVDRDINAAINLKRVGLDVFPTLKRRKGNPVVVSSTTNSTLKEVLTALFKASEAHAVP
ncbi:MAG: transposase [Coleofasciculus sp. B1-GNL1-01]|uniref:RNA-guided endonuclease InsQ/TnpB family protein n=1 Tax=Coleofasciculus sp. B1-GNL1-01 TaxID=3068484 RepID=UPI0032FF4B23